MRLVDVQRGREYIGRDGEIRAVLAITQRYGGVVQLDWISRNRRKAGKPRSGCTTPLEFARWAQAFHQNDQSSCPH